MKISGFTMAKNTSKLYYPIKEAILSILPIVDEFVVALGDCDEDDETGKEINSIGSEKIKIVHTKWDIKKYDRGTENAHQTDIAKSNCSGDWLFYLQADEVVHEKYMDLIQSACEKYVNDPAVEGFLFKYLHFWGDFNHYQYSHSWYKNEIRIVRNNPEIHSWESAQSFRRIPDFDAKDYRQHIGTHKLKVVKLPAYIYHYGWVRPPELMQKKIKSLDTIHKGIEGANKISRNRPKVFNYGPLGKASKFTETNPSVMNDWIKKFNWADKLNYSKKETILNRQIMDHDKLKYKIVSFLEQKVFNDIEIGGFKNYRLLKGKKYRIP